MLYSHHHDQLYKHIIHIHLHMHAHLYAEHNDDTIKTSDTVLRKIYLSLLFERVLCERELETEQNCNILTPTLVAISVSFLFSWAAQPGAWGPASLGAGFLYRILSPTRLVSILLIKLRAPSAGCWLSLLHLVTNGSGLQTDWISCALHYIIVQRPPSSYGHHNRTHSTRPRSRLYSDIPWADAPVI